MEPLLEKQAAEFKLLIIRYCFEKIVLYTMMINTNMFGFFI